MKTLLTLVSLIALYTAFQRDRAAFDATRAYDSARESLEALQRTKGHISPAFVCRPLR